MKHPFSALGSTRYILSAIRKINLKLLTKIILGLRLKSDKVLHKTD